MGNQVVNYSFTIIEDGQVPLAGNFETVSYTPVVAVVALCLIVLAISAYTIWFLSHTVRISATLGSGKEVFSKYYFHPAKLIRDIREHEYRMVSAPVSN